MSDVERTPAGLQMVLPGCERRTLPKSTTRVDGIGQGLLSFYRPPSLREQLATRADAPLRAEQRTKGIAERRFVQLLDCSQHPINPSICTECSLLAAKPT
jgi:hypothetical protein